MPTIRIHNKLFELFISEKEIVSAVERLAQQITVDMQGKELFFIAILNGSFMFAADLLKNIELPCNVSFIRLQSYEGIHTSARIKEIHSLSDCIEGKNVVIIEDIIETGHTMNYLLSQLQVQKPMSVHVATLLFKPFALLVDVLPDYVAFKIPNDFVVGYGLDYDGYGRNLKDIYKVKN